MKFSLDDVGTIIEFDEPEWVYYRLIDLATEYGFVIDNIVNHEIAVALLRVNALDDSAYEWLFDTASQALMWLNEDWVYPGLVMTWSDGEIVLVPDFADAITIVGTWNVNDVQESYGVGMDKFETWLTKLGLSIQERNNSTFKVVETYDNYDA